MVVRNVALAGALLALSVGPAWAQAETTMPAPGPAAVQDAPWAQDSLRAALAARLAGEVAVAGLDIDSAPLRQLYQDNQYTPLWVDAEGPVARALVLQDTLARAAAEGLNPADYAPELIAASLAGTDTDSLIDSELLLTAALMRYGADVTVGRLVPRRLSEALDFDARQADAIGIVQGATAAPDLSAYLAELVPHADYRALRQALAEYRALAATGGWPSVPDGETLHPGDVSDRIPALRQRLAATGEFTGDAASTDPTYDEATVEAVKRFQEWLGLAVDGVVGPATLAALNTTADERVGQIVATMERWRWLPPDLGQRYIMVNVPAFGLELVENGQLTRTMDVIVGRPTRETPLFSSALTYLEFNPTWTVPTKLALEDYLPSLQRDPFYLASHNIRLYSGWSNGAQELWSPAMDWYAIGEGIRSFMLRQDPGPGNSLGKVKFMMDNNFDVYLHDTPSRGLFQRSARAFSSGCIRLSDPIWLAEHLLAGSERWTPAFRDRIMGTWEGPIRVNLPAAMPLHVTYMTAWVDDAGRVIFRDDVYNLDNEVLAALDRRSADGVQLALAD